MSRWKSFGFVASTSASICGASSAKSQANQDALELLRALSSFIARPWRGSTCRKVAPYGSSSSRLSTASPHLARPINELWDAPLCPSGAILVDALEDLVPKDSMGPLATKQALKRTRRGHESCSNGGLGPHFQALESLKRGSPAGISAASPWSPTRGPARGSPGPSRSAPGSRHGVEACECSEPTI